MVVLMGYGFCIADNPADTFGLGFSKAVSKRIKTTKSARQSDKASLLQDKEPLEADDLQVAEQHWVRLKGSPMLGSKTNAEHLQHEFSLNFLKHFSIALENRRENRQHDRRKPSNGWSISQNAITFNDSIDLSRNKFHVLNALIMFLEKSRAEIRQYDILLLNQKPANQRQKDAATYRSGQLTILDGTLAELNQTLTTIFKDSPTNGVVQLQHILTHGPKMLVKDFRSLLHVAVGTRDAEKIRQRGGVECAFTLWLCSLWVLRQTTGLDDKTPLGSRLVLWLDFLNHTYGCPPLTQDEPSITPPQIPRTDGSASDAAADLMIAESYLEAIAATVEKHPKSLYSKKATITLSLMIWCLNIVREEGIRCPNTNRKAAEEEDEYIIFLEVPSQ